jgi:outer membrane protein
MPDKKYWIPLIIVLCISIAALAFSLLHSSKAGYIDNAQIYNSFTLKKELEAKLNTIKMARKSLLDSMIVDLESMAEKTQLQNDRKLNEQFEILKEQYLQKKQQFEEDNEALADQYTQQIWKQLNQYIKDYGQKNNYKIIFGTAGEGNLMYVEQGMDLTEEISVYVNKRYEGN